ncbi:MAG: hypothetical protein AAB337_01160 [Patescibacteria group bacterium]
MAAKNVSLMESGAGLFQGFVTGIMDIVREANGPFEAIYRLAKPEGRKTLEKMVGVAIEDYQASVTPAKVESPKPTIPEPTIEALDVKVDKTKTLAQLVAAGKYSKGCVNCDITDKNFSMGEIPEGKELVRVRLNCYLPNHAAVIAARAALKLEPVTSIAFILTVGADKPDLQKEAPVSDIDSVLSDPGGGVRYPYLWGYGDERGLGLSWGGYGFDACVWFLALRNIQP